MQFDGGLAVIEFGPGKDLQGQVDAAGIERIERALEAEAMRGAVQLATLEQPVKQRLIERVGLLLVQPRQRRAGEGLGARVIERPALLLQIGFDVTQALASAQLGHEQRGELIPATGLAQLLTDMMLYGEREKLMSRHEFEELGEHRARMRKGLNPSVFTTVFSETHCINSRDSGLLFCANCGTAVG